LTQEQVTDLAKPKHNQLSMEPGGETAVSENFWGSQLWACSPHPGWD
jgi:hypothetical protein